MAGVSGGAGHLAGFSFGLEGSPDDPQFFDCLVGTLQDATILMADHH